MECAFIGIEYVTCLFCLVYAVNGCSSQGFLGGKGRFLFLFFCCVQSTLGRAIGGATVVVPGTWFLFLFICFLQAARRR